MVVVNDYWTLSKIRAERTQVVLNTYEAMPGSFTTRPDMQFPAAAIVADEPRALAGDAPSQITAKQLATARMGDVIAADPHMLTPTWQLGRVLLSLYPSIRTGPLTAAPHATHKTP